MKHTRTKETAANTVIVEVEVDYDVPRKGDTINCYGSQITIKEDMKPRIEFEWDDEAKEYKGSPMLTIEPEPRIVFAANGAGLDDCWHGAYSWRSGEAFTKGPAWE